MRRPAATIVIPAHDAEDTLGEALASLRAQTCPAWEAVVVDDGSSDGTLRVARDAAAADDRIRVLTQWTRGPSAARNAGIAASSAPHVLFLDADDWIAPRHLETMLAVLDGDRSIDAVYCGWARVTPEGEALPEWFAGGPEELVEGLRTGCEFAIHACLVRRSVLDAVGVFDPELITCEDWDLWLRVARSGRRFGRVRDVLSYYRMRRGSLSLRTERFLRDGLRVVDRAYAADPRLPAGAGGDPPRVFPGEHGASRLGLLCWVAGLTLGSGGDARSLLDAVTADPPAPIDADSVAYALFWAALLPECLGVAGWDVLWPRIEPAVDGFLGALERQAGVAALAHRARRALERRILDHTRRPRPCAVGGTGRVVVEATAPIEDVPVPRRIERVQCEVTADGELLGLVELPPIAATVRGYVLADAIAAAFGWRMLGRFYRPLYDAVAGELADAAAAASDGGTWHWRGAVVPTAGLPRERDALARPLHDAAGWTVFLQDLWGRAEWPAARFYDADAPDDPAPRRERSDGRLTVDVGPDVPDVDVPEAELAVAACVGGVPLGTVVVAATDGRVPAQRIRAAICTATGFELAVAVVREALLGRPTSGSGTLVERLAEAARRAATSPVTVRVALGQDAVLAPGWEAAAGRALGGRGGAVVGRRASGGIPSSAARRAALPGGAFAEAVASAQLNGEPVVEVGTARNGDVVYAPDLLWWRTGAHDTAPAPSPCAPGVGAAGHGRPEFERLFARGQDPWHYATEYERVKYAQTLALVPPGPVARALEVGCAEGHFTEQLAARVEHVVAADISQVALDRVRGRMASATNVELVRLDLRTDPLPGPFDLIVCSEMLYYLGGRDALEAAAAKLAGALAPGGHLVSAHPNLVGEEDGAPGFAWDIPFGARTVGETFASVPDLRFVAELRTAPYRIQLFRREGAGTSEDAVPRAPERVVVETAGAMHPTVAASFVDRPSRRHPRDRALPTDRLPILMYHRVAPAGADATIRYRVTPEAFETQLAYLREVGFHGVTLEEWVAALDTRRPLGRRSVAFTFDDGYRDFATHAWPLLRRYGFGATVFLVADLIGRTNEWDRASGEEVPLLDWDEIARLHAEGVRFGSHSATHPALTVLPAAAVVREAAASRLALERGLGVPVTAFAYPYGDVDAAVQHLVGGAGYLIGVSCRAGSSGADDAPLSLPRIEVTGLDGLEQFLLKLDA